MQHKIHKLTVSERWVRGRGWNDPGENGYNQPLLRIGGKWLAKYGFKANTKVKIYATQSRLILEVENTPKIHLEDIPGQEQAKRALEIALVGNHSIKFIGNSEATNLNNYAAQNGISSTAFKPCPCGNFGEPIKECSCKPHAIRIWTRLVSQYKTDLTIKIPRSDPSRYRESHPLETEKQALKRVEKARGLLLKVEPEITNKDSEALMRQAISSMDLELTDIKRIEAVARSITALAGEVKICPAHLAEVLQYRPKQYEY